MPEPQQMISLESFRYTYQRHNQNRSNLRHPLSLGGHVESYSLTRRALHPRSAPSYESHKLLVRKTSTLVEALSEITTSEVLRMKPLSPEGLEIIEELARRYGVSTQAVTTLLQAVV